MAIEERWADAVLANTSCVNPENANGATDGVWTGNTDNTNWNTRWSIENPVDPLTGGATHTVKVLARKSASGGNGDPTLQVDLYDNGTLVKTLVAATAVTNTTSQELSGTFTTSEVSNGDNVQILLDAAGVGGQPAGRRNVQVDSINVEMDTEPAVAALPERLKMGVGT